jgi:uncharacterized protein (DUF2147 family)
MLISYARRIAVLPVALAAVAGSAAAAPSPLGTWIDHTGRGAVEITECNGGLCGHVVWLKSAADAEGCNMQILGNLKPVAGGKWDNGWIYDPERRSKFDVEITPVGDTKLKVVGYAGVKLFSETMTWTRAPADLKKCGQTSAETKPKEGAAVASVEAPTSRASSAPASSASSAPASEAAPASAAPQNEASGEVVEKKEKQARGKGGTCTISIGELGKFSFPC